MAFGRLDRGPAVGSSEDKPGILGHFLNLDDPSGRREVNPMEHLQVAAPLLGRYVPLEVRPALLYLVGAEVFARIDVRLHRRHIDPTSIRPVAGPWHLDLGEGEPA